MAATLIKKSTASFTAAEVAATVDGLPSPCLVAIQLAGTFTGTVTFEATVDNTSWLAIELYPSTDLADTALASTATAAGLYVSKMALAVSAVRARVSAFTSNTSGVISVRVSCV